MPCYFRITNPDLTPLLEEYQALRKLTLDRRSTFLTAWGDTDCITAHHDDILVAIKDPRTYSTPQPLPKGYRRQNATSSYVIPTTIETKDQFDYLSVPLEEPVTRILLSLLTEHLPSFRARLFEGRKHEGYLTWNYRNVNNRKETGYVYYRYFPTLGYWTAYIHDDKLREMEDKDFLPLEEFLVPISATTYLQHHG